MKLTEENFKASDLKLSCADIGAERDAATAEAGMMTGVIRQNRGSNQVAGYLGGLFILPLVAIQQNPEEKQRLDRLQERWDTLLMLARFKNCPATDNQPG